MVLIERELFLASLQTQFENIKTSGEGHCVFISGEAGIGKSSLVKFFCRANEGLCNIYQGMCDALFTPRPLAPLYDIALQIDSGLLLDSNDRSGLFSSFLNQLINKPGVTIIVFEDIHWADEATFDFIKFFARRITSTQCFFILTYRDDEIHSSHPLKSVLGQLSTGLFTRLQLAALSREAVEKLSAAKGYKGQEVYSISGGNPFYVTEILASYSTGVPDNIKDAIISVYNRQPAETRQVWDVLSIVPAGFEIDYLEKTEPGYAAAIENSLASKILLFNEGRICFKHELYRRAIGAALSPLKKVALNKKILTLFSNNFKQANEIERIVHHAKNANEYQLVVTYAPVAAKQAALVGAHAEASKLYLTAIEYYKGNDNITLGKLYEAYAYECYLTNHIKEAIAYQEKLLALLMEKNDTGDIGDCLRFLSRLWWYNGNRKQAETHGSKAVDVLHNQPISKAKALAFSNMSQLKMLSDETADCIFWGEKAIAMAQQLNDDEILAHALNNVGTAQMNIASSQGTGASLLRQSLQIAIKNSYHEHAARAYTNLGSIGVKAKDYTSASQALEAGIKYCEERDLDSWASYMLAYKARLKLETGHWEEALDIAGHLVKNDNMAVIVKIVANTIIGIINMRKGNDEALPPLLDAKQHAFETMELQRIIPVSAALLEYEWITGQSNMAQEEITLITSMLMQTGSLLEHSAFAFWLLKARNQLLSISGLFEGYQFEDKSRAIKAAQLWQKIGCPYEQAILLFEAEESDKQTALAMVQKMGANAVYNKMKLNMRASGIKSIPRGSHKSTQSNKASLTEREIDVIKLLKEGLQNKEIAARLFISAKTVDHHISAILFKLDVNSRIKAVHEAVRLRVVE